jgi:hypothetical protein
VSTIHPAGVTVTAFEDGDIDPDQFDHEAHIYAAWLYVRAFPAGDAADRFVAALKRLTLKLGIPGKYHDTITRFFLALIAERRERAPDADWTEFRNANRDLFDRSANVLTRYYSPGRLDTEAAKRSFVLPDRSPGTGEALRTAR